MCNVEGLAYYVRHWVHSHSWRTIGKLVDSYDALVNKHEIWAKTWQGTKQWTIDLKKELQKLTIWEQH